MLEANVSLFAIRAFLAKPATAQWVPRATARTNHCLQALRCANVFQIAHARLTAPHQYAGSNNVKMMQAIVARANEAGDLPNDALGAMSGRIRSTIERIELIHEGALSRWYRNPVWGAVLLPIGGVGLVELLPLLVGRP